MHQEPNRPKALPDNPPSRGDPRPGPGAPSDLRGLAEAPAAKRPHSLWQKLKHVFDYGNGGGKG